MIPMEITDQEINSLKIHLLLYWGDSSAISRDEGLFQAMATAEYVPFLKEFHSLGLHRGGKMSVGLSLPSVALNAMSESAPKLLQILMDHLLNGIVELIPSTAFKVILPLLDAIQAQHQVHSGKTICQHHFPDLIDPHYFHPPELAIDRAILRILQDLGVYRTFISESALGVKLRGALPYFTATTIDRRVKLIPVNLPLSVKLLEVNESTVQDFLVSVKNYTREMMRPPVLILEERLMTSDFTVIDKLRLLIDEGVQISKPSDLLSSPLSPVSLPHVFPRTTSYEKSMIQRNKKISVNPPAKEIYRRWRDHINPLHLVLWNHLDLINLVTTQFFKSKRDEQLPEWFWDILGAFDVSIFEQSAEHPIKMNEILNGFEKQRRALTSLVSAYSGIISENLQTVALEMSNKISERLILIITELLFSESP